MNGSKFMDKQIMDLSRSKSGNHSDFIDLMNPPPEEEEDEDTSSSSISANLISSTKKQHQHQHQQKPDILPSYDFHPIRPTSVPAAAASSDSAAAMGGGDGASSTVGRAWGSTDSKSNASTGRSYGYLGSLEPDKAILEKAQNLNGAEIVSEIDRTMKKHTENLLHAIDSLSARLSQLESRTRQIEHSVDDLKDSIGNSHGSTDGKMRQLENILREVQTGVHNLKDKQEVIEVQMNLAKLQIPKAEHTAESHTTATSNVDPAAQQQPYSAPQHQQFLVSSPKTSSVPVLPHPNAPPPPSQQPMHSPPPPPQVQNQYSPSPIPSLPQRDGYFPPPSQTQEVPAQQYLLPSSQQPHQQQSSPVPSQPQQPPQYQSGSLPTPYQQAPQPPQLNPPPVGNPTPHLQPPLGHHSDGTAYMPTGPSQSFPPSNPHQPPSQLTSGPPPSSSQGYYGVIPHQICDPPPPVRSSSGFSSSAYPPPPIGLPSDQYPYSGSPSRYDGVPPMKAPPLSSSGGGNYPQIPAARILPQAIPTAASVGGGGGGAGAGGSGNRVPIDDVIDKVTSMGFPREHVRATVRKLTENGQSVDLNIVLDKLTNDGDMQPQRGWFGR